MTPVDHFIETLQLVAALFLQLQLPVLPIGHRLHHPAGEFAPLNCPVQQLHYLQLDAPKPILQLEFESLLLLYSIALAPLLQPFSLVATLA